jgi:hypothetical protein
MPSINQYLFGNSLLNFAEGGAYTNVPVWMDLFAEASGDSYAVNGGYGFLREFADRAEPVSQWGFPGVDTAWNDQSQSFAEAQFDSVLITPANFIQDLTPNTNFFGDARSPLDAVLDVVGEASTDQPGATIMIYQGWADMAPFSEAIPPAADALASYHAYNMGAYTDWYTTLVDQVNAADPDANVQLLPVASILSDLFTSVLSDIPAQELYVDSAPHGTETTYFLASMIVYQGTYGTAPALPTSLPATIHPSILANFDLINTEIASALSGIDLDDTVVVTPPVVDTTPTDEDPAESEEPVVDAPVDTFVPVTPAPEEDETTDETPADTETDPAPVGERGAGDVVVDLGQGTTDPAPEVVDPVEPEPEAADPFVPRPEMVDPVEPVEEPKEQAPAEDIPTEDSAEPETDPVAGEDTVQGSDTPVDAAPAEQDETPQTGDIVTDLTDLAGKGVETQEPAETDTDEAQDTSEPVDAVQTDYENTAYKLATPWEGFNDTAFAARYYDLGEGEHSLESIDFFGDPDHAGEVAQLDYREETGSLSVEGDADFQAAQFHKLMTVTEAGTYRFDLAADDEATLMVDGQVVLETRDAPDSTAASVELEMEPGAYTVTVNYLDRMGEATLELEVYQMQTAEEPLDLSAKGGKTLEAAAIEQEAREADDCDEEEMFFCL